MYVKKKGGDNLVADTHRWHFSTIFYFNQNSEKRGGGGNIYSKSPKPLIKCRWYTCSLQCLILTIHSMNGHIHVKVIYFLCPFSFCFLWNFCQEWQSWEWFLWYGYLAIWCSAQNQFIFGTEQQLDGKTFYSPLSGLNLRQWCRAELFIIHV